MAAPPAPRWSNPGDTTVDLEWDAPPPSVVSVEVQVREFPRPWEEAQGRSVRVSPAITALTVRGLAPQSTYEFRLAFVYKETGVPVHGPSVAVDTQAVGCTPSADKAGGKRGKRGACAVQ